jgi:hypothetical protein
MRLLASGFCFEHLDLFCILHPVDLCFRFILVTCFHPTDVCVCLCKYLVFTRLICVYVLS